MNRRQFLTRLGIGGLTIGVGVKSGIAQEACTRASGFGSYLLGPFDPGDKGTELVYLSTDLGFDETYLYCKIATNYAPFRFPTARLGVIEFAAHEFFMDMESESINSVSIEETVNGFVASFSGVMRSETRVFSGDRMRSYVEDHISFGCLATHLSNAARMQVSQANFAMTANFAPDKEHAAIFGEKPTFAGRLTRGSIVVTG